MPVTIYSAPVTPEPWNNDRYPEASSAAKLLHILCTDSTGTRQIHPQRLIQSSFSSLSTSSCIHGSRNGFVHACLSAYNLHHDLIIRPDDVWTAILTQLSIHLNSNGSGSASLRKSPANHSSGSRSLSLWCEGLTGNICDWDHASLARTMGSLLVSELADPLAWNDWLAPGFSTTTPTDEAVASIILMGAFQKFFEYSWGTRCGIPSITLLGTLNDWVQIRQRCMDHLAALDNQTRDWLRVLQPVLHGFVMSFTQPDSYSTRKFWSHILDEHQPYGSGKVSYSGWLTAFCYWDENGRRLHPDPRDGVPVCITADQIPLGYSRVPVTLYRAGSPVNTEMLAGSVGIQVVENGFRDVDSDGDDVCPTPPPTPPSTPLSVTARHQHEQKTTIQPVTGWLMYEV